MLFKLFLKIKLIIKYCSNEIIAYLCSQNFIHNETIINKQFNQL